MPTNTSQNEINKLLPRSLDEIIKAQRDEFRLEKAFKCDLEGISTSLPITNLQGILETGFIYKWVDPTIRQEYLFLVGHRKGSQCTSAVHTNRVVAYDPDSNVVLTKSGSQYIVEKFIDPDSDPWLLLHICNFIHQDLGLKYYGVSG